jgi:hypothetical protein
MTTPATNYTAILASDPAVQKPVADAVGLGQVIASDALVFAHSVIGHVSGAVPGIVADVSTAALNAFYDVLPGQSRGIVQAIVGSLATGAITKLDSIATADVLGALGWAVSRLTVSITAFTPTTKK